MVDMEENQLFVISDSDIRNKDGLLLSILIRKISRSVSTYGYIGNVIDWEPDTSSVLVDLEREGDL